MPKKSKINSRRRQRSNRSALIIPPKPLGIAGTFRLQRTQRVATYTMVVASPTLQALVLATATFGSALLTFLLTWDLLYIRSIRVRLFPRWNVNAGNANSEIPQIAWVVNTDDGATPTSFDQVQGQGGAKLTTFDKEIKVMTSPRILVNPSGSAVGTILVRDQWLNTSLLSGGFNAPLMKFAVSALNFIPASGAFDVYYDFDFELRQALTG